MNYIVVKAVQLYEYIKNHGTVHLKRVSLLVCELYCNKVVKNKTQPLANHNENLLGNKKHESHRLESKLVTCDFREVNLLIPSPNSTNKYSNMKLDSV